MKFGAGTILGLLLAVSATALGQNVGAQNQSGAAGAEAKTVKMSDLFRFGLVNGAIVIDSDLARDQKRPVTLTFNVEGIVDPVVVNLLRDRAGKLTFFRIWVETQTKDRLFENQILCEGSHLRIAQSVKQGAFYHLTLDLEQRGADGVELDDYQGEAAKNVTIRATADSFEYLVAEHPEITEQYIYPMLRGLQMEELLGPTRLEMRQVFAAEFPVDAKMNSKVLAVVAKLDADSPDDRAAAVKKIGDMGDDGLVCLLRLDRSTLSPQQNDQIDALCGKSKSLSPEQIAAARHDARFLLSCLLSADREIRAAAFTLLKQAVGRNVAFDPDGDRDARVAAVGQLRKDILTPTTAPSN